MVSVARPEAVARKLLDRVGYDQPPVDLDSLVSSIEGIRVSRLALDSEGYLVDLGPKGAEIFVRQTDPETRARFTIAHELGHWVLNRRNHDSHTADRDVEFRGLFESDVERW